jgi:hypothetical protein
MSWGKSPQPAFTVGADLAKTTADSAFAQAATGGAGNGAITYSSGSTSVATVDSTTGLVTIVGVGTTAITATKAADGDIEQATVSYELTVTKAIYYPSDMFPKGLAVTSTLTVDDYKQLVNAIHAVYEGITAEVAANFNERGRFVGCLIRMAGHDFMDFRSEGDGSSTGGADGCIDFGDGDNTGLPSCLTEFKIPELYAKFSDQISLADFLVVIGEAVAGRTATGWDAANRWNPDSLEGRFVRSFKYGRRTTAECNFAHGRMPNPEHGCEGRGDKPGLKQLFVDHIYQGHEFAWTLTAAISGAHTVGSAKPINSGYNGYWSSSEEQGKFNNDYFKRLVFASWVPEPAVGGNPSKNQ